MGGSSTTTNKTEYDPAYMARINANYDRTKGIADAPFQAYTGERVAGFTPAQLQGQAGLLGAANDPTGTNGILSAFNTTNGLLNFQPRQVAAPNVDVQKLSATDLAPYMNPYTQNVIDATLSDIGRQRAQQGVADNAAATAAHAFGGSRQGVQNALTTEAYDRNALNAVAGLRQAGFQNAQTAALADIGQQNQVGMFNAGNAYDVSKTNAANDITGAGMRGAFASQLASLSDQQLTDALKRAGIIEAVGASQQGLQQAQNDAAYEEFLRQLNDPYQKQALLNSSLGMFPVQATQTTTQKSNPGALGIIGGILGGAKTAANLGWQPFG